jgi:hypothetical protein
LFNLKGYDIPAEFSDEAHAKEIEKDIQKFDSLHPYTPKKYADLDHTSKNLDLEITRELLNRAQDNNHQNFFELTDEVKNSSFIYLFQRNSKMVISSTTMSFSTTKLENTKKFSNQKTFRKP